MKSILYSLVRNHKKERHCTNSLICFYCILKCNFINSQQLKELRVLEETITSKSTRLGHSMLQGSKQSHIWSQGFSGGEECKDERKIHVGPIIWASHSWGPLTMTRKINGPIWVCQPYPPLSPAQRQSGMITTAHGRAAVTQNKYS